MISSEERSSEKKEKRREKQKSESRSNNYIKEDAECVAISFDLYFLQSLLFLQYSFIFFLKVQYPYIINLKSLI